MIKQRQIPLGMQCFTGDRALHRGTPPAMVVTTLAGALTTATRTFKPDAGADLSPAWWIQALLVGMDRHGATSPRRTTRADSRRTPRPTFALAAAAAKVQAGAFDTARESLSIAAGGPLSDFQQARIDVMEADLAFVTSRRRMLTRRDSRAATTVARDRRCRRCTSSQRQTPTVVQDYNRSCTCRS
jgi:hypothetical protein